ncbi:MAG: molybdenum cofactor biosynthesis protein [Elusimicrobia bacterium RIFOXYD12_FULL_66_9]|nr:MAG: molybdenum cofactor biosynthesis protein [Elusimicrobia bacterium RIFOXYD12_FULL_66_9]
MTPVVAILTVSDRAASGERPDAGGPALRAVVERRGWRVAEVRVVADESATISSAVRDWCDGLEIRLVLTTGGTGLSPRDVTPEATRAVLDKELPGFGELMRLRGLETTPTSVLSRALAGSRGSALVVNLPGSPKGAVESFEAVADLIPHALAMLSGADHAPARGA